MTTESSGTPPESAVVEVSGLDAARDRFARGFTPRLTDVEQAELLCRLSAAEQERQLLHSVAQNYSDDAIAHYERARAAEARAEAAERWRITWMQLAEALTEALWTIRRMAGENVAQAQIENVARAALAGREPQ